MKKIFLTLLISVLLSVFIQSTPDMGYSQQGNPLAILSATSGTVQILNVKGNVLNSGRRGTQIYPEQIVSTSGGSACTIMFKDNSSVRLGANSKILFSKVRVDSNRRRSVAVLRGEAFVEVVGGGNAEFTACGPTAVAGVRGTGFFMQVADDGSSKVVVTKGAVAVKSGGEVKLAKQNQWVENNIGERGVKSGQVSETPQKDLWRWNNKRKAELKRNPGKSMKVLASEIKNVDSDTKRVKRKVDGFKRTRVNAQNARQMKKQVVEVDANVVENSGQARAIRETATNIAREHASQPEVRQNQDVIEQYGDQIDQQINSMDQMIENASRAIDQFVSQQERQIDDMIDNPEQIFRRRNQQQQQPRQQQQQDDQQGQPQQRGNLRQRSNLDQGFDQD